MSRIALVKPDRARAIEQLLMRMAQSGQLRGRVSEDQLIDVLDQVRALRVCVSCSAMLRVTDWVLPWQVEAMEKGQGGATGAKSASKITVRCLCRFWVMLDAARVRELKHARCADTYPLAVHAESGLRQRRRLVAVPACLYCCNDTSLWESVCSAASACKRAE